VNLIFLALLDNFVSFFRDEVFSNINTADFAGKNVRDLLKSYFEENPILNQILGEPVIILCQRELQIYRMS